MTRTSTRARTRKRKVGRPPRLVEAGVRERLLEAFTAGCSVEASCYAAGIAPATFYNWANRAAAELDRLTDLATPANPRPQPRSEEWPFVELLESVSRVRAERQQRMLGIVDRVAQGGALISTREEHTSDGGYIVTKTYTTPDWRAAQWWIERAFPAQFGRQAQPVAIEVTGKGGGPIEVAGATVIAALAERLGQSYTLQREDRPELTAGDDAAPVDAEVVEDETAAP